MLLFSDLAITPCNYLNKDYPYPTHAISYYCIKRLPQDKTLLDICLLGADLPSPLPSPLPDTSSCLTPGNPFGCHVA